MHPLARAGAAPDAESVRVAHLEAVEQLLRRHGRAKALSPVLLHLYWTLYTGVLAFWVHDNSRHQEDTLVVLDHALQMFVRALPPPSG
jgi:hypothetical protein